LTDTPIQIDGSTPISVELTAADAQLICQLADMSVRTQGLQAAKPAIYIADKFDAALSELLKKEQENG